MARPKAAAKPEVESKVSSTLLASLQKKFGKEGLFLLEDGEEAMKVSFLPTGISTLDNMLGGGLPQGKIIEISGLEGTGKTSLCLQMARNIQQTVPDKVVVYIDAEGSNDFKFMAGKYGLDLKRTIVKKVQAEDSAESILGFLEECSADAAVSLIILDSIASLVSEQDASKDLSDGYRDNRPQLYSRFLRRMSRRPITTCPVVLINQLRMNQNAQAGSDPYYTTGGKALGYYTSLRMRLMRVKTERDGDRVVGFMVQGRVDKARYSTPKRSCQWMVSYQDGISTIRALLADAIDQTVITKSGAWFIFGDERFHGLAKLVEKCKEDPEFFKQIEARVIVTDGADEE